MLPKLDVPTYEIELPISKKKIKYRPFLVKEQKNLLMAVESDDANTIQQNVYDVLNNCTLSENIDINKLPIIDVEYYFINLRAKSVGEIIESKYKCNNEVNDVVCGNSLQSKINLLNIKPHFEEEVDPVINLNEKISIKLKYPEFSIIKNSVDIEDVTEITFNMIADSVEYVYDGEQFYYAHESQPGEMLAFVESLNQQQFEKIEHFFNNLPRLKETVEMTCGKCGFHHKIDVEGLENFFG
jgi:hypothetical protein